MLRGKSDIEGYRKSGSVDGGEGEYVLIDGGSLIPHIKLGVTENVLGLEEGSDVGSEGEGEKLEQRDKEKINRLLA